MSEFVANLLWERGAAGPLDDHSRDHTLTFGSGQQVRGSAAPEYKGAADRLNPEEAFVGALSACHMLTFLAIAAVKKTPVERYEDAATGILAKNAEGRLAVTEVVLRPMVRFVPGVEVSPEQLDKLHAAAHRGCFIAQSVRTAVRVEAGLLP
jgi:organic hydroperoxide reductase OsmC/OhrA